MHFKYKKKSNILTSTKMEKKLEINLIREKWNFIYENIMVH